MSELPNAAGGQPVDEIRRVYSVLIVEDDVTFAECLRTILSCAFRVDVAHTAQEGLDRITHGPRVDAVLLDLMLPNGHGLALVGRYQAATPDVPLVVITGYEFSVERVLEAGAQEYLQKPVGTEEIESAVIRAVARHRVRRAFAPTKKSLDEMKVELAVAKQAAK